MAYLLDTVQDFLNELGMKPFMHLVEISIFSLNRQTYQNYEQNRQKLGTFLEKQSNSNLKIQVFKECQKKKFYGEYWTRRPTFIQKFFLKILIFNVCTLFSKNVPNFCRLCS